MSTPYELPVLPAALSEPAIDVEPLPQRAPLHVVPDPDRPATAVDFDDFVRRQTPRLRRLIMRKLGDPSEAEEIAQETLLRAHQHLHTLGTEDELIAWTTVVGQRLAIDRLRVRGRSVAVAEVPEDSRVGRDTADIVVARAEARTALEALEAIPERQAAILWAREVEGLHYDAIAERFGITEPAVRSLLHRGRRALRNEYAARGGTLPLRGLVPIAPSLLALRGLNRLRAAARETVKSNVSAFATMSIAGALALGMTVGGGLGALDRRAPSTALGDHRITQQTFNESMTPAGDIRAIDRSLNPSIHAAQQGSASPPDVVFALDGGTKLQTNQDSPGDALFVNVPVVGRRGIASQTLVGVCEHIPGNPVVECERSGTPQRRVSLPTVSQPKPSHPSSVVEGATQ